MSGCSDELCDSCIPPVVVAPSCGKWVNICVLLYPGFPAHSAFARTKAFSMYIEQSGEAECLDMYSVHMNVHRLNNMYCICTGFVAP